jgi:hypothetical protein
VSQGEQEVVGENGEGDTVLHGLLVVEVIVAGIVASVTRGARGGGGEWGGRCGVARPDGNRGHCGRNGGKCHTFLINKVYNQKVYAEQS